MRLEVSRDEAETTFRAFCGQMGRLVTFPFLPVPSSSSQSNTLNEALSVRVILYGKTMTTTRLMWGEKVISENLDYCSNLNSLQHHRRKYMEKNKPRHVCKKWGEGKQG